MRLWISRLLIAIVAAWNLQAALIFVISPETFVHAYELSGVPGEASVRGVGILFLMWNVPYVFAVIHPIRFRLGLVFAMLMQLIGLLGESYIFSTLTMEHTVLRGSILRFIIFDGIALVLLFFAWLLSRQMDAA